MIVHHLACVCVCVCPCVRARACVVCVYARVYVHELLGAGEYVHCTCTCTCTVLSSWYYRCVCCSVPQAPVKPQCTMTYVQCTMSTCWSFATGFCVWPCGFHWGLGLRILMLITITCRRHQVATQASQHVAVLRHVQLSLPSAAQLSQLYCSSTNTIHAQCTTCDIMHLCYFLCCSSRMPTRTDCKRAPRTVRSTTREAWTTVPATVPASWHNVRWL